MKYLAQALGITLVGGHHLGPADEEPFVLSFDSSLKAVSVSERREETGVGKSALGKLLDDEKYVLTLDFTLKMLNIHERREGGIPAIIEGETGVGKTALVKMLSQLWNLSLRMRWNSRRGHILDKIQTKVNGMLHTLMDPFPVGVKSEH